MKTEFKSTPHITHIKEVQDEVAKQFFIGKKSIEWLAVVHGITKANVLYCITESYYKFCDTAVIIKRSAGPVAAVYAR